MNRGKNLEYKKQTLKREIEGKGNNRGKKGENV